MRLQFQQDVNDYYAAYRYISRRMMHGTGWRYAPHVMGAVAGCSLMLGFISLLKFFERYRRFDLYELTWGLGAMGVGAVVFVLGVYVHNRLAKGRIFDPDGLYRSPHTVNLTDTHLVMAVRSNKYTYAYRDMLRVEENRAYVYVFIDSGAALYIPTKAFANEKSKREFLRELAKRIKAATRARRARSNAGQHPRMALRGSEKSQPDRYAKWTRRFLLSLAAVAILAVPGYFYAQKKLDEAWSARVDAMREKVCAAISGDCLVKFSAYDEDMFGLPKDNLNDVAHVGKLRFVAKRDGWRTRHYESAVLTNPTWLEVTKSANEMIKVTGDTHHTYLEDIEIIGIEAGTLLAEFVMGS